MFGQRLAAESDPAVPARTGLQQALSDYILAFEAIPRAKALRCSPASRLDEATLDINRLETGRELLDRPRFGVRQLPCRKRNRPLAFP